MKFLMELAIKKSIAGHLGRDREVLNVLRQNGVDPILPRNVDLTFIAPNRRAPQELRQEIERLPFNKSITEQAYDSKVCLEVKAEMRPFDVTKAETVERFVRLAAKHGGDYDGWGTAI